MTTGKWDATVAGDVEEKFSIVAASAAYTVFASDLTALKKSGVTDGYTNYTAVARRALNEKWKFLQMVADVESAAYTFWGWHDYDVGPGVSRVSWTYPKPTTGLVLNDTREVTKGRGKLVTGRQQADKARIDQNARRV